MCGAGGFIGSHLVRALRAKGWWVRWVDVVPPRYSPTAADEFLLLDLRDPAAAVMALEGGCDVVFQLAADMGGMGFISDAECEVLHNNALIEINMVHAAATAGVARYFFSSSVCVYRDMEPGEPELDELDAYPAMPDNEYGWEKLYAERVALAYARHFGLGVRIARFENCYGPEGAWSGGREKAPAALRRKIAESEDGGRIEVWGDGSAVRSYVYVADLVEMIATVGDKRIEVVHAPGPVGVQSRNFSHAAIESLGWRPRYSLCDGLRVTYPWIAEQVSRRDAAEPRARA